MTSTSTYNCSFSSRERELEPYADVAGPGVSDIASARITRALMFAQGSCRFLGDGMDMRGPRSCPLFLGI